MKSVFLCVVVLVIILMSGCQNQQQKVWGIGELPAEWQEFFGNDNTARLDLAQTEAINNQGKLVTELVERVSKLEDESVTTKYEAELERRGLLDK